MTITPGSVSQSVNVRIVDDTGLAVTGLVAATFPAVKYKKSGANAEVSVTLADLATTTTAWASGGVKESSVGVYRLDLPDAAVSTAARLEVFGEAGGKHLIVPPIDVRADAMDAGSGPYPINHSGGVGLAGAAATIDLAAGTTFAAWAPDALKYTGDGTTGVSGLTVRAYQKTAYDAATGTGLSGTTVTATTGRWAVPLNLASGDYYVIADTAGDLYQSSIVSIRVP